MARRKFRVVVTLDLELIFSVLFCRHLLFIGENNLSSINKAQNKHCWVHGNAWQFLVYLFPGFSFSPLINNALLKHTIYVVLHKDCLAKVIFYNFNYEIFKNMLFWWWRSGKKTKNVWWIQYFTNLNWNIKSLHLCTSEISRDLFLILGAYLMSLSNFSVTIKNHITRGTNLLFVKILLFII